MKILFCTPDPTPGGGVARSATRIIGGLRARGHQVVLTAPDADLFPGDVRVAPTEVRFAPAQDLVAWADVVGRVLGRERADLVVGFYGSSAGAAAVAAGTLAGLPTLVALRGNDVDRDWLLDQGGVRFAIQRATVVCTVSSEMARKVAAWAGVPAQVVGNSVDPGRFFPDPQAGEAFRAEHRLDGPVLGMFGVLKPKRGVEALHVAAQAGYKLLVMGHVRPAVANLVPNVATVLPYAHDDATMRAAYAACDLVLQPSHHDGVPNVVLEAMACGRVVVGRRRGGIPDVLTEGTGLLFDDDAELGDLLAELRRNPRLELGDAARLAVPHPEVEAARWQALLDQAVASRA